MHIFVSLPCMKEIVSIYAQQINKLANKICNLPLENKIRLLKHYNVPVIVIDFCGAILKINMLKELHMRYYFVINYKKSKEEINNIIKKDDIVFLFFDWRINNEIELFLEKKVKKNVFIIIKGHDNHRKSAE